MNAWNIRSALVVPVLVCGILYSYAAAATDLSPKQARKVMTRIPGFELKSSAVRVKSIATSSASTAELSAEIRTVFKFETDKAGNWRVGEIRTGQDQWESIDLIANAVGTKLTAHDCNVADPPFRGRLAIDPSIKRTRCLLGSLLGIEVPSDTLRIQEVAPMPIPLASQPSATVVAWVKVEARLTKDSSGWRVSDVRIGNRDWLALEPLLAAVNQQKQQQARAELESIAKALEKFRRASGFYVVSDKQAVAVDYLSPRYLARVIRVDPWHRPYLYLGERDRFTLRSAGPDGKADTPDDISLSQPR
jgi:hypothetical protein